MADLALVEGTKGPGMVGRRGSRRLPRPVGDESCEVQLMGMLPPSLLSIALDPLYPSRCSWETFGYATSTNMAQASDGLSPLQLSGQLNSLPCSLAFRQEETISIIRLIEQVGARSGRWWRWGAGSAWGGGVVTQDPSGLPRAGSPPGRSPPGSLARRNIGASGSQLRFVSCRV